jgi:hypothetical protein
MKMTDLVAAADMRGSDNLAERLPVRASKSSGTSLPGGTTRFAVIQRYFAGSPSQERSQNGLLRFNVLQLNATP